MRFIKKYVIPGLFLFMIFKAKADRYYFPVYKCLTVKTNIISFFNMSVDVPVFRRFSAEMSARHMFENPSSYISWPETTILRLNLKYHIPLRDQWAYDPAFFLVAGKNYFREYSKTYKDQSNYSLTEELYAVERFTLGAGLRTRRTTIWLAYEKPFIVYNNYSRGIYTGYTGVARVVRPTLSAGLAINLFNIIYL